MFLKTFWTLRIRLSQPAIKQFFSSPMHVDDKCNIKNILDNLVGNIMHNEIALIAGGMSGLT